MKELKEIRELLLKTISEREELLKQVKTKDIMLKVLIKREMEKIEEKYYEKNDDNMSIDTVTETNDGWEFCLKKAREVKEEKNQLIIERNCFKKWLNEIVIPEGKMIDEIWENYQKNIENLQIKENEMYDKVKRISKELFLKTNNYKYVEEVLNDIGK